MSSISDRIDEEDLKDHVQSMKTCQAEREHNERAKQLIECFRTPEALAEFMHQGYRATAKALAEMHGIAIGPVAHDHGWRDCYGEKKRYFIRRAKWLMSPLKNWNGRV